MWDPILQIKYCAITNFASTLVSMKSCQLFHGLMYLGPYHRLATDPMCYALHTWSWKSTGVKENEEIAAIKETQIHTYRKAATRETVIALMEGTYSATQKLNVFIIYSKIKEALASLGGDLCREHSGHTDPGGGVSASLSVR